LGIAAGSSITIERGSHSGWNVSLKSRSDLTWKKRVQRLGDPLVGQLRRRQVGAGVEQAPPRVEVHREPPEPALAQLATVLISTVLYVAIGLVLTGLVPYTSSTSPTCCPWRSSARAPTSGGSRTR
jgi:hypothetical protein